MIRTASYLPPTIVTSRRYVFGIAARSVYGSRVTGNGLLLGIGEGGSASW